MLNWEGVTDTDEDRGLAEKECEVLGGGGQTWVGNQRDGVQGGTDPKHRFCAGMGRRSRVWRGSVEKGGCKASW